VGKVPWKKEKEVTSESPDKHSTNVEINAPQDVPSLDSDALQNALLAAYHPSDWLRNRLTTDLRSESTFSRENSVNQPSLAAESTGEAKGKQDLKDLYAEDEELQEYVSEIEKISETYSCNSSSSAYRSFKSCFPFDPRK
jgi:hypothetical protein